MNAHLVSLQEQVDNLYASLAALSNGGDSMPLPAHLERSDSISKPPEAQPISPGSRPRSYLKHSSFRGPTSSAYNLDVANNTLHNMGYQSLSEMTSMQDPTPVASPPGLPGPTFLDVHGRPLRDPLWSLNKEEMTRLCRVYEEEMGLMYPVVNIEEVIVHGKTCKKYWKQFHFCGIITNCGYLDAFLESEEIFHRSALS